MSKPAPKDRGICFPKDKSGGRSTSDAGKAIIAAALRGAKTEEGDKCAAACEKERKWRFKYNKHFQNLVKVSATSPEAALGCAHAGVQFMHQNFEFVEGEAAAKPFSKYMSAYNGSQGQLNTASIGGKKGKGAALKVNYKGRDISGTELKAQFNKWAEYGTIEPDAAESLMSMCDGNLDLKGQHYVLIGAGSAMGPYSKLLEHGATVVCIDIPGKWGERPAAMWKRLFDIARNSPGQIVFPIQGKQSDYKTDDELIAATGCNLMEAPAQILEWLKTIAADHPMCVGNYTYLDGEMHVKLAITADAIIAGLCHARKDTKVAFLCTPTDLHVITDEAHKVAKANNGRFDLGRLYEGIFQLLSAGKWLQSNVQKPLKTNNDSKTLKVVDGLSVAQGPNYALAKRLQHWRAMIAYEEGHVVSSNVAPSTATLSVVSNRTFGWAYGGMPYFQPYEIFQQETTNGVMGAMLMFDTTDKSSAANPKNRKKFSIENTLELFKFNSVHGGVWRAGYTVNSIGEVSVLIHFMGGPAMFIPVMTLLLAALYYGIMVYTGRM